MAHYLHKLLGQRTKRSDIEIAWELRQALEEKRARGHALSAPETLVLQVCEVSHCDGIGPLAEAGAPAIAVAAEFAKSRGLPEAARILADAARGVPVGGPVSIAAKVRGKLISIPIPHEKWGATDLALSLGDEDLDAAILDYVAEQPGAFAVGPPAQVAAQDALGERVAKLAAAHGAAALLHQFASHKNPIVRACLSDYDRKNRPGDWLDVPVTHQLGDPANPARIAALAEQYGAAAADLLAAYAAHDGAALFVQGREAGFHIAPIAEWPEHQDQVMQWAREVTWNQDPEELPDYLESAIPFGYIPGDYERWLLITRGQHAGTVMLSDTDSIDDQPRYASIGEFFAALILDTDRVLGCGGHVSYADGKTDAMYYPREYKY